ncbi:hypothetical protein BOX15_Mlig004708g1 [Macrostomum lignano]|uniref:Uncharacterized protein n=1 Tax=Macrostomum lignano TaxID=282301 RepID=A0A267GQX5_9PLAT|nr:hypothetical protein BOX15_Mlig004708g1 [Macrostomum lignano]
MSSASPGDDDDGNAAAARAYVLAEHRQSSDTRPTRILAADKQVELLMGQDVKKNADSLSSDEQQIRKTFDQSVQHHQQQLSSHCQSSEITLQNVNSASGRAANRRIDCISGLREKRNHHIPGESQWSDTCTAEDRSKLISGSPNSRQLTLLLLGVHL